MSKYYQRGRADAAKGVYDPPETSMFDSKKESERILKGKEEYREGYHDKKREREGGKKKSGGCFVTTACVEMLGLPDECRELTILRNFRDGYLMATEAGREAVELYYEIAPKIVTAIRNSPGAEAELRCIYDVWIRPSVELIEQGRHEEAFAHYRKGIESLVERYGLV